MKVPVTIQVSALLAASALLVMAFGVLVFAIGALPQSGTVEVAPASPVRASEPVAPRLWRGLKIAAENRCSPYDSDDYSYAQALEADVVDALGGQIYGPYTGRHFATLSETDIEHIVARSEAHDSGLCAAGAETRSQFASDVLNLTLASPEVNRHQKAAKDAAEWLPSLNKCWFVDRVVHVRQKYKLTVDQAEADAIDRVLADCDSVVLVVTDIPEEVVPTQAPSRLTPTIPAPALPSLPTPVPTAGAGGADALARYDDNGNGRITCAEARRHGIAPVHRGHPAYEFMRDGDGDGVVCE